MDESITEPPTEEEPPVQEPSELAPASLEPPAEEPPTEEETSGGAWAERLPPVDDPPEPPTTTKTSAKMQCEVCLRFFSKGRVGPGKHKNCFPPQAVNSHQASPSPQSTPREPPKGVLATLKPAPPTHDRSRSPSPPDITEEDVMQFSNRHRSKRQERKRQRWQEQMFG